MEISSDERFLSCLKHLAVKYHTRVKKVQGRYKISLSTHVDQYQLFDSIINQIVTTMKAFYLQTYLRIKNKTLIKVLINYDKKSDTVIAGTILHLSSCLLLDSIYDFAITRLKCRWHEIVQLVNENYLQLTQKVLFNELLRFLILNMDCRIAEAHVMLDNNPPLICDKNLEPLPHIDEDIIDALIEVAPRQIFIHAKNTAEHSIIEQIEKLFPNCVCIEYNAVL